MPAINVFKGLFSMQRLMWVKECFQRRDHITVFNLDGGDGDSKDIDVAILHALLKGMDSLFSLLHDNGKNNLTTEQNLTN